MVNHTMSTPTTSSNTQKLIIVGNGMVGHHFAEQLLFPVSIGLQAFGPNAQISDPRSQ